MPSSVPPPPTTPPWEAARQIRLLARQLRDIQKASSGGTTFPSKPSGVPGKQAIEDLSSYNEMKRFRSVADGERMKLENVIPTRKTVLIKEAVTVYRNAVARERVYADRAFRYAGDLIDLRRYESESLYDRVKNPGSVNNDQAKKIVESIARLAQCLPTQEHLPSTKHEMIIRSIVAILRAHNVEGIEKIVGEAANGKDNTDGQKEVGKDGDAAASIAATLNASIGAAVSAAVPAGEIASTPGPSGINWGNIHEVHAEPGGDGEPSDEYDDPDDF